jgi:hypothetical protein
VGNAQKLTAECIRRLKAELARLDMAKRAPTEVSICSYGWTSLCYRQKKPTKTAGVWGNSHGEWGQVPRADLLHAAALLSRHSTFMATQPLDAQLRYV